MEHAELVKTFTLQKERHQMLRDRRVRLQSKIEDAKKRYDELAAQARELYGTDDIDKLRELAATWKRENEANLQRYTGGLDELEKSLAQGERIFEQTGKADPPVAG